MTTPPVPEPAPSAVYPPSPGAPSAAYPGPPAGPAPYGASRPQRRRNPAGLAAVILVGVLLLLQLVMSVGMQALIANRLGTAMIGSVNAAGSILQGVVALTAVILGAIGLAGRDKPRALAGIGLGGGAVVLFSVIVGFVTNALLFVFYS